MACKGKGKGKSTGKSKGKGCKRSWRGVDSKWKIHLAPG